MKGTLRSKQQIAAHAPHYAADHVLVVECNVDIASSLKKIISFLGYKAMVACTQDEALALMGKTLPGAIFFNLDLRDADNHKTAEILSKRVSGKETRFIALKGCGVKEDEKRIEQPCYNYCFPEQLSLKQLTELLQKTIPNQQESKAHQQS